MENQQKISLTSSFKKGLFPLFILFIAWIVFFNSDFNMIISGIAIFLIGMLFMEDGFKLFTGGTLEKILERSTNNLPKSIGIGLLTTSIVQSSSLISVIIISFLSAELISLSGAIGVIFGSNIGSTTTAWIVSSFGVKISIAKYAMPMLIFGVIFHFNKNKSLQGFGKVLIGLGFVFLGIAYMKDGFEVFQGNLDLSAYVADGFLGILIFILLGAIATILIQSSGATMALIITALVSGQIDYTQSLALAIGANIGTTVTAVIGALASNHNGKRLAVAHFIFNIVTALVAIIFLNQLAQLVDYLAVHINIAEDNYAMKLALFHTIFNLIGVLAISPFTSLLVKFLEKLFIPVENQEKAKYLDLEVIKSSSAALVAIKKEVEHLYENTTLLISHALLIHRHEYLGKEDIYTIIMHTQSSFDESVQTIYDSKIKYLYSDIVYYNTLASDNILQDDKNKLYKLRLAAQSMVSSTKDIQQINKNLLYYTKGKNQTIIEEYNVLRLKILQTLNTLENIRYNSDDIDSLTTLELFKEEMKNFEHEQHAKIDKYIREKSIDSGGVTTSTVTVPLVAALGIGLATNIEGRSALIDGFGLIAFASLFPMITVMLYGLYTEKVGVKSDSDIEAEHKPHPSLNINNFNMAHVNIDATEMMQALNLSFSALVLIVPQSKVEDALHAARDYGATGVTHFKANGMGLKEMDNIFRVEQEANDEVLLFILPDKLVEKVLNGIIHRLHITSTEDGIAFTMPISNIKGISLRQKHIFEDEIKEETKPKVEM